MGKNRNDSDPEVDAEVSREADTPLDPFYLEQVYPDATQLFLAHKVGDANDKSVLIALDTNALLLPYQIKTGNVTKIGKIFERLANEKRLFVPGRVIREFIPIWLSQILRPDCLVRTAQFHRSV